MKKKKHHKKSISRKLRDEANIFFSRYENNVTRSSFIRNYARFIEYCRKEHNCKTKEECKEQIFKYIDYLKENGYTSSTIHTYLAPVGLYHGVSLAEMNLPKRHNADNIRSRKKKKYRASADTKNPLYYRTVEFQKRVGIRRNELKNIISIIVEPICVSELFLHGGLVLAGLKRGDESCEIGCDLVRDEFRHSFRAVMSKCPIQYDGFLIMACIITFTQQLMTFEEVKNNCIDVLKNKYTQFEGKADRKEFWYFALAMFVVSFVLNIIPGVGQILSAILALATLVPSLALGARRMHDINKSGWFMLVCLIPIIGAIIFLYFAAQPSADAPANNEQV